MRTSIFFFFAVLLFSNCKKNKLISFTNPAIDYSGIFDMRTVPYDSIYNGSISSSLLGVFPSGQYPEKFLYKSLCINPNNKYEFCYMKVPSDSTFASWTFRLYKYNFITGKSNFIANNVVNSPSWGSNDWILFVGLNNSINKIKPNGDSLTQLALGSSAKWSPTCKFFIDIDLGELKIYDSHDKFFKYFDKHRYNSLAWINDSLILTTIVRAQNDNALIKLNIITGEEDVLIEDTSTFGLYISDYNIRTTQVLYGRKGEHLENLLYLYKLSNKENKLIMKTAESWGLGGYFLNNDKLLCNLTLKDYFGLEKPTYLYNVRQHIGVVDLNNIYNPRRLVLD